MSERQKIWVCCACGKTSPDRYGGHPDTMRGWDASCHIYAVECWADNIVRVRDGRVIECTAVEEAADSNREGP